MSAIAAIYQRDGRPLAPQGLEAMLASMAHRGPDGLAAWRGGPAGLGQAHMHTTPEAFGEQMPLAGGAGLVLAADARLDGRGELARQLGLAPAAGDGALILAAYERWGERCAEHLAGDFAFAIWDERRRRLFCARDHFGVRSLYYHLGERLFACATEIKALLTLAELPRRLNEQRLGELMAGLLDDQEATLYAGVVRLPPAHTLTVDAEGARLRRYWELEAGPELRLGSDEEYAEAFRSAFAEAVRSRTRGDQPVGAALSGGLDSSAIACMAQSLRDADGRGPVHTFSAVFPSLPAAALRRIDERAYVDAVVAMHPVRSQLVRADELSPLGASAAMQRHLDEMVLAPNLYLHWAIYGAAREQGLRIFLDGHDGDTTVSHGLEHLSALLLRGRLGRLRDEARGLARNSFLRMRPRRIAWELAVMPLIPPPLAQGWQRLRGGLVADGPEGIVPINPAFARRINLAERARRPGPPWQPHRPRHSHAASLRSPLMTYVFEMADRAAAAFGVEPRYPFFDRRLVELCVALPSGQKLQGGWTRSVMRRALAGILPPAVQWRAGKADLSPNFVRGFASADRPLVEALLADPAAVEPYVDVAAVRAGAARYLADPDNPAHSDAAIELYGAVNLDLWLRSSAF